MYLPIQGYQRSRLIQLTAGLIAIFVITERLWQTRSSPQTWTEAFIWGTTFLATVLVIWREKNHAARQRAQNGEDERFIAAAESSQEAFLILDAVRNLLGEIVDFRFKYANSHALDLLKIQREELLDARMIAIYPGKQARSLFDKYRAVVLTGDPLSEEITLAMRDAPETWIQQRVIKLGDGIAITASNHTEVRAREERNRHLSSVSNSVFEGAPFSIIETDTDGLVRGMNRAAEKLTGFARHELVGKPMIANLHDAAEIDQRMNELNADPDALADGFALLTQTARRGEEDEREWTYIRRDGSTLPVHLAMIAVRTGAGEISGFIATASDITERKQMMTYVNHLSSHDQLTGMAGRSLLRDRIAEAIERATLHGRKVAVFVLDIDHFKRLNDSLGHKTGDRVLIGMAERMREALRRSDTLGRLGGDELVFVMPHIATLADVERCARRLVERVASTTMIDNLEVNLTASVGVCVYPDFASDVDSLLERADAAMYAAKEHGRNRYQVFADAMLKDSQNRLSMDAALRHALAREELFLHYQPLVSLTTGRVIGMEALLRWNHPKLGVVSPATFVPLAEETGLIVPIGEWVLKQACLDTKMLCDRLGMSLSISVNLSPRQFEQSNLLDVIVEALEGSGLSAKLLQVELTENTLMINSASNLEKLQQIRDLGGRVAIDDFGTGFCSFSYLLQYPVDRLKIDQSFVAKAVTDPNAATVVRTIVAMSHHMGVKVVAEGVETAEHLQFLSGRRCDEAQGYFFSRPVSAANFPEAVSSIHCAFDLRKRQRQEALAAGAPARIADQDEYASPDAEADPYPTPQIVM